MTIALQKSGPLEVVQAGDRAPAAMSPVYLGSIAVPAHEVLDLGRKIAVTLAQVITQQELYSVIQKRKYVHVEGWTTMGAMLGVTPREVSSIALEDGSYEATIELARTSDGQVIGRASAICGSEATWKGRDAYARKSMATTRATGKAFRLAFSWIMKLAGYEPTPAEEMPHGWGDSGSKAAQEAVVAETLAEMRHVANISHDPDQDIAEDPLPPSDAPQASQSAPGPRPAANPKAGTYLYREQAGDLLLFGKAKKVVGEAAYRNCLRFHKVDRSLQFTNHAAAFACLADLRATAEAQKAQKAFEKQKAEAEANAASLPCHRAGSGCDIVTANQIAAHIKTLGTPFAEASMALTQQFQDRKREYPDSPDIDHWRVILIGLENVVKGRVK